MSRIKTNRQKQDQIAAFPKGEKILLATLPFWTPLVPSLGIAVLKRFLQTYEYQVKAVDLTGENQFLDLYRTYFSTIKKFIPVENRGNFYNIGHDVLRNHMMAHINYTNEKEYIDLVKAIIYSTYYYTIDHRQVVELNQVLEEFYQRIKTHFLDLLEQEKPSILGLSVNSGNISTSTFVFRLTREHHPHIKTVMGGCIFFNHLALGTPDLEFFLEKTKSFIDKVIIGKGEIPFIKLLQNQLPASQRVITSREISQEDEARYPTPGTADLSDYTVKNFFYLSAAASTSCPFNCSFCNVATFFGNYRKKDAAKTAAGMMELHRQYGHRLFFMNDALLNPVIKNISLELLKFDVSLYMDGYFIVDDQAGNFDNTLLWRRGGFYRARLGVESGSQRMLDIIGKKITPEKTRTALANLAAAGIKTTTYWVVGHPGETEEDFQQTLDLLEELRTDIWQAECNPFMYAFRGQTQGDKWADKRMPVFPETARDLLMIQTWGLDCQPDREEIYKRVCRFVQHCQRLGIPNPYSFQEIYQADLRWKKLHKNAVPTVAEIIHNEVDKNESKQVKKILKLQEKQPEEGDFGF